MIVLEDRPNPLDMLVAKTGSKVVQNQLQESAQRRESKEIDRSLAGLSEESSPLDWLRAISSAPEKHRKGLMDFHENLTKGQIEREKIQARKKEDTAKAAVDQVKEEEDLSTVEQVFGPTAAKLWKSLPQGGRTEAFKAFADPLMRGKSAEDIEAMLTGLNQKHALAESPETVEKKGMLFPPVKKPEDLRQKDLPAWRTQRRKENIPELKAAREKINAAKKESAYIDQLKRISPLLPEGWARVVINPETGEPYKLAQLTGKIPPATQLWVKTVNDFTTKAKDSFGARVTNFDLERFMARLPSLLNSPQGREAILDQMKLINELDSQYEDALTKVFTHYGAGDVTLEEAEQIAEDNIAPRTESIKGELNDIVERLTERDLQNPLGEGEDDGEFPPAAQHRGRVIEDENGQRYRSNGTNWVRV